MKKTMENEVYQVEVVRTQLVRESAFTVGSVGNPENAIDIADRHYGLRDLASENVVAICLDVKNRVATMTKVGIGNLNSCIVDVKTIARTALLSNSASVVMLHNHPSGNPEPSREDIEGSIKLGQALKMLDIVLLDSIVVASDEYVSLRDREVI